MCVVNIWRSQSPCACVAYAFRYTYVCIRMCVYISHKLKNVSVSVSVSVSASLSVSVSASASVSVSVSVCICVCVCVYLNTPHKLRHAQPRTCRRRASLLLQTCLHTHRLHDRAIGRRRAWHHSESRLIWQGLQGLAGFEGACMTSYRKSPNTE